MCKQEINFLVTENRRRKIESEQVSGGDRVSETSQSQFHLGGEYCFSNKKVERESYSILFFRSSSEVFYHSREAHWHRR